MELYVHLGCSVGEFTRTLEDGSWLTLLLMFGEANAMGIILEGEDQVNLKYLTVAMTSSRLSGKLTYAT